MISQDRMQYVQNSSAKKRNTMLFNVDSNSMKNRKRLMDIDKLGKIDRNLIAQNQRKYDANTKEVELRNMMLFDIDSNSIQYRKELMGIDNFGN